MYQIILKTINLSLFVFIQEHFKKNLLALLCCSNLSKMWALGDYNQRQELQNALFECGIIYDRNKDECRSTGDNEFVSASAQLSKDLSNFKPEDKKKLS